MARFMAASGGKLLISAESGAARILAIKKGTRKYDGNRKDSVDSLGWSEPTLSKRHSLRLIR